MKEFIKSLDRKEIHSLFHGLFSTLREAAVITNTSNRIQAINPAFTALTGYAAKDVIGKKPWFLKSNKHNKQFYKTMFTELHHVGRWQGKAWNKRKNGELCLTDLTLIRIPNEHDCLYLGIFSKYDSEKSILIQQNNLDPLTHLPNRMLFQDHLRFMIAHARRNNQILALLLLDINRFKVMNETLGFNIGDLILINTARRLKENLREVDGVFRLGNDEFAIVLESLSKIEDASMVAKKILSTFTNPFTFPSYKGELFVSVNVGISMFPQDGNNNEHLITNAETAMYQAKGIEQNNFQHYSPEMNMRAMEHMTLEHQLHKALEQREFVIYYQPIVEMCTGNIVAAESLIRWNHPELGLVPPLKFIPIAEETGLIIPIGDYVMRISCEKVKEWQNLGFKDMYISVNLSARQFQQHDLVNRIESNLSYAQLSPHCLNLEITESVGMKNAESTIQTLHELKKQGIQVSIDDFGTGYSSLSYLKKFPIDTLKIDQSFVRDIGNDHDCEAIISLIIAMAHTLKLRVVAEGVETKQQLDFLVEKKCDLLQGYLFSRPVSEEVFEQMLTGAVHLKYRNRIQSPSLEPLQLG